MLSSRSNIQPNQAHIFKHCWPEHRTAKNYSQGKVLLHKQEGEIKVRNENCNTYQQLYSNQPLS